METTLPTLNTNLIVSFFKVAEAGSLMAAAKANKDSLAKLSRHVADLESQLGTPLFDRRRDGMHLTKTGTYLLDHARALHEAKVQFALAASGLEREAQGTVRISASTAVISGILPKLLKTFSRLEPKIQIELVSSYSAANLMMGEADLALRSFRPTQGNLITKKVGAYKIGAFASASYVATHGYPKILDDLSDHTLIGEDSDGLFYDGLAQMGFPLKRESFKYRTDCRLTAWALLTSGCGIGFASWFAPALDPSLKPILPHTIAPEFPIWLVAPPTLRSNLRLRRTFDFLAETLPGACKEHQASVALSS